MFIGIDGTKGGWVYCFLSEDMKSFSFKCSKHFELSGIITEKVFVDIPIGLPSRSVRTCDVLAKKLLSKRACSVFTVPVRAAVYSDSYKNALTINRKAQGKGFSKQFWNIREKVIQVDSALRSNANLYDVVRESHPELCFMMLSGYPLPSKHTREGITLRLSFLKKYVPKADSKILEISYKIKVPIHDLIDATVLALSQFFELNVVPEHKEFDEYGIPMRIFFPKVYL
ncbi:MAG: DUF429 domain-containing protein [Fervidobacterium sp.]|nr:DUF429 domain-containing protein [Fervidobacterium sp.]